MRRRRGGKHDPKRIRPVARRRFLLRNPTRKAFSRPVFLAFNCLKSGRRSIGGGLCGPRTANKKRAQQRNQQRVAAAAHRLSLRPL